MTKTSADDALRNSNRRAGRVTTPSAVILEELAPGVPTLPTPRAGRRALTPRKLGLLAQALAVLIAAAPLAAQPRLDFEATRIVAHGLTPSGQAFFFNVSRIRDAWMERIVPRIDRAPVDAAGVAVLDLTDASASTSIWVVVDGPSRRWTGASPPSADGEAEAVGQTSSAEPWLNRSGLFLLVVRSGEDAWYGRATGAGPDETLVQPSDLAASVQLAAVGADGSLSVDGGPEAIESGDLIVGIDATLMQAFVANTDVN